MSVASLIWVGCGMEAKIFRVKGIITKKNFLMPFSKDVRAMKQEDAVEKIYTDFGSQQRVKRVHVKISSVNEISIEETKDVSIRELGGK